VTDTAGGRRRTLRHLRAPGRSTNLDAILEPDGSLRIDGQDSGNGAAESDEYLHYRWTWRIAAGDVPAALAGLGVVLGTDPLDALEAWVVEHGGDPGMAVRRSGVPIEFTSRVGD
jgi:hypothetical protein